MPELARARLELGAWKFFISKPQRVLLVIGIAVLVLLGFSSRDASKSALLQSHVLTSVETPATSIIFAQRETLVYSTRLAQWSGGTIPRRDVQIARALLAQRLQVVDSTGKSVGATAPAAFWSAIKATDALVASTNPGTLSPQLQPIVKAKLVPIIDAIAFQARALVFTYENAVDAEIAHIAQTNGAKDSRTVRLLDLFIALLTIFLLWIGFSNLRLYRESRDILTGEQRRIEELLEDLDRAENTVQVLKSLNEEKNSFISTVNHELRTPMTSIIGYTEALHNLMEAPKIPLVNKYLQVITRNADIMLNLIESMLSISKLESQNELAEKVAVDINAVIEDSIFVLQPNLEKAKLEIEFIDLDQQEHVLQGSSSQISQVFLNLIGNAIKFSPENSRISVRVKNYAREDGQTGIEIQVEDRGIGIPEADQHRVFQRFFRAKNAVKQQYSGTGLGLSIVGRVIELHNGSITLESREGHGTLFSVRLPN